MADQLAGALQPGPSFEGGTCLKGGAPAEAGSHVSWICSCCMHVASTAAARGVVWLTTLPWAAALHRPCLRHAQPCLPVWEHSPPSQAGIRPLLRGTEPRSAAGHAGYQFVFCAESTRSDSGAVDLPHSISISIFGSKVLKFQLRSPPPAPQALYDGQYVDAHFTRSFYKHMLGQVDGRGWIVLGLVRHAQETPQ